MYEIFEELLKEKGLSVAEISRRTGIAKSTLSDWKNGKFELKAEKKRKIAEVLGVSLDYLDGLTSSRTYDFEADVAMLEELKANRQPMSETQKRVLQQSQYFKEMLRERPTAKPLYRTAAGEGAYNDIYTSETIGDVEDGYEYAKVIGNSMLPEIRDGDIVKVKLQEPTTPNDFTLIKVDGEHATVKHVEVVENGVWLRALNKEVYEDRFFSVQEVMTLPVTIIGKVVQIQRNV